MITVRPVVNCRYLIQLSVGGLFHVDALQQVLTCANVLEQTYSLDVANSHAKTLEHVFAVMADKCADALIAYNSGAMTEDAFQELARTLTREFFETCDLYCITLTTLA